MFQKIKNKLRKNNAIKLFVSFKKNQQLFFASFDESQIMFHGNESQIY